MLAIGVQHGGVGPAGDAFFREGRGDLGAFGLHQVDLERPGAGSDDAFVLEVVDLDHGVVPVAADELTLATQQIERCLVLVFIQFVGILDAEFRLVLHEVERGVGDVDRAVIGLDAALVRLTVGKRHFLEHHLPAGRCFLEGFGVVHQDVRTPDIGRAIMNAVLGVPGRVLQALVDGLPRGDEVGVDRLNALAGHQAERGIARGGDQVEAAFVHQRDHFVGGGGGLDGDLAAGLGFELGDPVIVLVGFAALDIAGPGDDGERAFTLAEFLQRLLGDGVGGKAGNGDDCGARLQ